MAERDDTRERDDIRGRALIFYDRNLGELHIADDLSVTQAAEVVAQLTLKVAMETDTDPLGFQTLIMNRVAELAAEQEDANGTQKPDAEGDPGT